MRKFNKISFYNFLNKDVNELNYIILSVICVSIIVGAGVFSYFITNSYALFSDEIISENVIEIMPKLYEANIPVLSSNMIPVYYDEDCNGGDGCWKKADANNENGVYKWYDYDNKMWANSVTVSENVRDTYLFSDLGTEIKMSDILTMQVWIPRYKYTVWNYNSDGKQVSDPQEININFERGKKSTGEIECTDLEYMGTSDGTPSGVLPTSSEVCKLKSTGEICTNKMCNGKTYTHPAFTFGNEELEGFWVGKFELSSDIECEVIKEVDIGSGCNLDTIRPLVKPDLVSWRGAMVSVFENNMMAMNDNDNKYGFAITDDTHMMKNMEWGAVAYLSHSKYGVNGATFINNSSKYYTGRSGGNVGGSTRINGTYTDRTETSLYNEYGFYTYDGYLLEYGTNLKSDVRDLNKVASTTGNIYGIYDMSGGSREYLMAGIVSPDGNSMMVGERNTEKYPNDNTGFSGILYYDGETEAGYAFYSGIYSYPDSKYYDKYSFNFDSTKIYVSKLGDAIKEVLNSSSRSWYRNASSFITSENGSFQRGSDYMNFLVNSGVFYTGIYNGAAIIYDSSRLVIS